MPSLPDGTAIYVATPSMGTFPVQTLISYLDTQEVALKYGIKIDFGFSSCSLVHHARTLLGNIFLSKPEFTHIFWIDSDIVWKPADFLKLILHSAKHECVVGVYPRRSDPAGYFIDLIDGATPDEDGLVEINGTGLGFACIRREVMEKLALRVPKLKFFHGEPSPSLFRCDDNGVDARGEDYAFWSDVREMGYRIYADATITLGHVGAKVYECRAFASTQ